jgi:hypothetical protein
MKKMAISRGALALGSALLTVAAVAVSLGLLFKAGCSGDIKGGALGDPSAALHLEALALAPALLALVAGACTVWLLTGRRGGGGRAALVVAWLVSGVPLLWIAGVQMQAWGTQACL